MKLILLIMGWLCLWPVGPLHGHGFEGQVTPGGLAVSLQYSSGEAMSFAKVTIVSPADGRTFQVGHADRNDRFCFSPDAAGDWQIAAPVPAAVSRLEQALVGVSLIFGLAGLGFSWQARKKTAADLCPKH